MERREEERGEGGKGRRGTLLRVWGAGLGRGRVQCVHEERNEKREEQGEYVGWDYFDALLDITCFSLCPSVRVKSHALPSSALETSHFHFHLLALSNHSTPPGPAGYTTHPRRKC